MFIDISPHLFLLFVMIILLNYYYYYYYYYYYGVLLFMSFSNPGDKMDVSSLT